MAKKQTKQNPPTPIHLNLSYKTSLMNDIKTQRQNKNQAWKKVAEITSTSGGCTNTF